MSDLKLPNYDGSKMLDFIKSYDQLTSWENSVSHLQTDLTSNRVV